MANNSGTLDESFFQHIEIRSEGGMIGNNFEWMNRIYDESVYL